MAPVAVVSEPDPEPEPEVEEPEVVEAVLVDTTAAIQVQNHLIHWVVQSKYITAPILAQNHL